MIFNLRGLFVGGGSLLIAFVVGHFAGWAAPVKHGPASNETTLAGLLLLIADLAIRLPSLRRIHEIDPPTKFTREGPILNGPQPVMKVLNVFLSGERGAQFFWVVPGWVAGLLIASAAYAAH